MSVAVASEFVSVGLRSQQHRYNVLAPDRSGNDKEWSL